MEYSQATQGRIFVLRFDHGDDPLEELKRFAAKTKLSHAVFMLLGAFEQADLVTGPKHPVIPPIPNWVHIQDAWESMGIGTLYPGPDGPALHLHAAAGRKTKTRVGCVRKGAKVFLTIEAVVWELKGLKAKKAPDPKTGVALLRFGK